MIIKNYQLGHRLSTFGLYMHAINPERQQIDEFAHFTETTWRLGTSEYSSSTYFSACQWLQHGSIVNVHSSRVDWHKWVPGGSQTRLSWEKSYALNGSALTYMLQSFSDCKLDGMTVRAKEDLPSEKHNIFELVPLKNKTPEQIT